MIWLGGSLRVTVEADRMSRTWFTEDLGNVRVTRTFRNEVRRAERRTWTAARRIGRSLVARSIFGPLEEGA